MMWKYETNVSRRWRIAAMVTASLVVAGCDDRKSPSSSELAAMMRRDVDLRRPAVSGPHRDILVERESEEILTAVQETLGEAGVTILQAAKPGERIWLFGKSLADRQVLVEILPIVRGSFVVRVTVEGADLIMRELLDQLAEDITRRTRGRPVRNW